MRVIRSGSGAGAVEAEVVEQEQEQELVLEPGLFIAVTNIRLRTAPDIASEPTGKAVKGGEVFEATEVLPPQGPGALGYLRVGERGWVFDRGVSGEWLGKPIVDNVPEEDVETYSNILSDPSSYAAYRSIMDDPNHLSKIQSLFNEKLESVITGDPDKLKEVEKMWKDIDKKPKESVAQAMPTQAPAAADAKAAKQEEADATKAQEPLSLFETMAKQDPEFKDMLDKVREKTKNMNPKKPNEPTTMVAPRWMKLAGVQWAEIEKDEEGKLRRPFIKEPPGGERTLRHKPGCGGWRMGIRVPSVCSPM